jgi:septum formation protein
MEPIVLASGSPRREEYFRILGLPFSVMPVHIDETVAEGADPEKTTKDLAVKKVERALELLRGAPPEGDRPANPRWIFGADTLVSLGGSIFGKARSREEAGRMLARLSGRRHRVITALALYSDKKRTIDCRPVRCDVDFAGISPAEIEWYLDSGEWQGVAGAYRLQGLAACFIQSVEGPPGAVVGLPLRNFYVMLRENGYPYGSAG